MSNREWRVLTVATVILFGVAAHARAQAAAPDLTLDSATREVVISGALQELNASYVSPEVAARVTRTIEERRRRGDYAPIVSARQLADALTAALKELTSDQHLRVVFSTNPRDVPRSTPPSPEALALEREAYRAQLARSNFGFETVDMIRANVGYLDVRAFLEPALMGETAAAAMGFLANTDALIIDLRANGGGSPDGVAFLASYLFGAEPVHLNDIYDRRSNETRQFWTLPYVPGKRLEGKPVYLLTSARTFSAAEDFAYALRALGRVTIVGETTRGGAHPTEARRIDDHFFINVPWGRSLNPITKANWERVGVEPHVKVPADAALTTALVLALEARLAAETDPNAIEFLENAVERARQEQIGR